MKKWPVAPNFYIYKYNLPRQWFAGQLKSVGNLMLISWLCQQYGINRCSVWHVWWFEGFVWFRVRVRVRCTFTVRFWITVRRITSALMLTLYALWLCTLSFLIQYTVYGRVQLSDKRLWCSKLSISTLLRTQQDPYVKYPSNLFPVNIHV